MSEVYFERVLRNKVFPAEELLNDMSFMLGLDKNGLKKTISSIALNLVPNRRVEVSVQKLHTIALWLDELERVLISNKKGFGLFSMKKNRNKELELIRKYKNEFMELIRE